MPSPFPGMNPYLEQTTVFHDFHERFCPTAAEILTQQLRPNYIVKIDEHIFIHELPTDSRSRLGRGDVIDQESLSFLEIRDRDTLRVITVIELLSPSNKLAGSDREQYVAKRNQILHSQVHLVEIDLLRGMGSRMPMKNLQNCDYYVLISRHEERPDAGVWPIQLRDPLPTIPVPLQTQHETARLDLQNILHRVYDAAGYEDYIYRGQPEPAFKADVQAWARQYVDREVAR